jgi:hypothetical protein
MNDTIQRNADAVLVLAGAAAGIGALAKPKLAKPLALTAGVFFVLGIVAVGEKARAAFAV